MVTLAISIVKVSKEYNNACSLVNFPGTGFLLSAAKRPFQSVPDNPSVSLVLCVFSKECRRLRILKCITWSSHH